MRLINMQFRSFVGNLDQMFASVSWAHHMKGGAHPTPSLPYPSLIRNRFTAVLKKRVLKSSDGESWVRTHDLQHNRAPLTTRDGVLLSVKARSHHQFFFHKADILF